MCKKKSYNSEKMKKNRQRIRWENRNFDKVVLYLMYNSGQRSFVS